MKTSNDREKVWWEICCDGWYPYCSNCRYEPPKEAGMTPYCPMCGAKMENSQKIYVKER